MKPESMPEPLEGCAAFQWQLSELADQSRPMPDEVRAHLATCEDCAHFARLWLDNIEEPVAALQRPPAKASPELHRKITRSLAEAMPGAAVRSAPFPASKWDWRDALLKAAAVAAVAAFSFWLLQPKIADPPKPSVAGAVTTQALVHTVAAAEQPLVRERQALCRAAVEGGVHLRETLHDSLGFFE